MAQDKPFPNLGGLTFSEDVFYRLFDDLLGAGIVGATDYQVIQNHLGANMSVDVNPGSAYVFMTNGGKRRTRLPAQSNSGTPGTPNSADNWLTTFVASDPTNPRVDRVVLTVRDTSVDGSGASDSALRVIAGTPTAGATLANLNGAAAVPANSLLLANVLVPNAATTVTTANIANVALRGKVGTGNLLGSSITTSTLAGGPPASPNDGDIWVATAAGPGTTDRWMFQYDAAWVTDAFKWKFIGGPPSEVVNTGSFAIGGGSVWTSTGTFTTVRSGVYRIHGMSMSAQCGAAGNGTWNIGNGVNGVNNYTAGIVFVTASQWANISGIPGEFTGTVGGTLNMMYNANQAGTGGEMGMTITPVRII